MPKMVKKNKQVTKRLRQKSEDSYSTFKGNGNVVTSSPNNHSNEGSPNSPESQDQYLDFIYQLIEEDFKHEEEMIEENIEQGKLELLAIYNLAKMQLGSKWDQIVDIWSIEKMDDMGNQEESGILSGSAFTGSQSDEKVTSSSDVLVSSKKALKSRGKRSRSAVGRPLHSTAVKDRDGFLMPTRSLRSSSASRMQSSESQFKTPMTNRKPFGYDNIALVTPGPAANAPIRVMRRPEPGETAISLGGSPLLISTDVSSRTPNITLPIDKNKILSVFPWDGFDPSTVPALPDITKSQLKKMSEYLAALSK